VKIAIPGLLFLAVLGLKLAGHITWSWWWVTAPLWGGALMVVSFVIAFAVVDVVVESDREP
jgi:hypothetical protein